MKKLFIFITLTTLFFVSCQKEESYSCDPEIDEWAKNNVEKFKDFDRTKISTYDIEHQKAILRTFSPEKKKQIWQKKVNYINSLSWTDEERKYIDFFTNSFNNMDYENTKLKEKDKYNDEIYSVLEEAFQKFKWDNTQVFELFFIVGDKGSYKFYLTSQKNKTLNKGQTCDCRWNLGCPGWDCIGGSYMCDETQSGCGVFGGASCRGICNIQDDQQQ